MYYALTAGGGAVAGFVLCWVFRGRLTAELALVHVKLDKLLEKLKQL